MAWVGEERIESLCDVNYVDIGPIYQIICRQVQRNLNTYKWSVMGVPLIEILILIVFGHLRDPRQRRVTRGGGRVMMSSDQLIKYQLTSNWDLPCFCWFRDWVLGVICRISIRIYLIVSDGPIGKYFKPWKILNKCVNSKCM